MTRNPRIEDSEAPPPNPDNDHYVGQILADRYRITGLLREGGMSRIYVARHLMIKRRVAVKILNPALAMDKTNVRRFLNEARAAGSIGHPNIVESLDMGYTAQGVPFLVLELLDGVTLAEEIQRTGDFPAGRAAYVASAMASALGAAHAAGIVHRDVKPENVQLTSRANKPDHVKVLDFGISKVSGNKAQVFPETKAGVIVGTPEFMAPEQVIGSELDGRTDIYALGATLYTMLAGAGPFSKEPFPQVLHVIVSSEPESLVTLRPDLPLELIVVVERAMAKAAKERFQTMDEVEVALRPFVVEPEVVRGRTPPSLIALDRDSSPPPGPADGAPPLAMPLDPWDSASDSRAGAITRPAPRRHGKTVAAVTLALCALVALGVTAWIRARHPPALTSAAPPPAAVAPMPVASVAPISDRSAAPPPPTVVELDVRSDTPFARATVRGKAHALPYKETIHVGADPELVEVTAPARQGRRFWLPLDQPRHLFVSLPHGSGMADASPAETAIALGEAAQLAGADREVRRLRYSPPQSRAAVPAADPAPESSAPAPEPEASAPTGADLEVPQPVATIAAPVPPLAPTAVPTPGTVDPRSVSATVRSHAGEVRTCFQNARMFRPDVHGKITVRAQLTATGKVSSADVAATTADDSRLEACVVAAFKSWSFPPPAGGAPGAATYTLNFE
jgi:TonB family protein